MTSRRLLSRVLVGVAIGLILMGARAVAGHAASSAPITFTSATGQQCASIDVGAAERFTLIAITDLASATNGTLYAFPERGGVWEIGNGRPAATSYASKNGPTTINYATWETGGLATWKACFRFTAETSRTGTVYLDYADTAGEIDAMQTELSDVRQRLDDLLSYTEGHLDPDGDGIVTEYVAGSGGGGSEPQEISGTVALSAEDRERLDLGWWGTWAVVGSLLVLMISPALLSAMRVTRGM